MPMSGLRALATKPPTRVCLGERLLGAGRPAYVIAEAGVNHDGVVAQARALIEAAAAAQADAVKFQVFDANELASAQASTASYQRGAGGSQRDMLRRLELNDAAFREIATYCAACKIEFLATPFGVQDVTRLEQWGVRAIKIASTDLNNLPLLRRAATTDLPLIVSTGAATENEIAASVERLHGLVGPGRLVLMHCVSCYPTPLDHANLRAIATLRQRFGVLSGFSDHTTSTLTGALAVALGATVIEKHLTMDRAASGPDHAMSLTPADMAAYIANIRTAEIALGSGQLGMSEIEADVRGVARKSVVAAGHLRAGDALVAADLTVKRPDGGIPPDQIDALIGRRLRCDVAADAQLTWDMLQ